MLFTLFFFLLFLDILAALVVSEGRRLRGEQILHLSLLHASARQCHLVGLSVSPSNGGFD